MNPMKVADAIKALKAELGGGLVSVTLTDDAMTKLDARMALLVRYPDDPPHKAGLPWEINGVSVLSPSTDTQEGGE